MKLVDANLLLYATDRRSPRHPAAKSWLDALLSGDEPVALAWAVLLAFLRLSTNPRIFVHPLSPDRAFNVVESWVAHPCAAIIHPGDRHLSLVRQLLRPLGTAGNHVTDAHLAALAIEHGAELNSCDADFSRFSGLRWVNPLDAP
ncbi:MAG: type II toxin-antitoxin system VapC family toxin [Candidatus Rokuibacteriota bacterium]